MEEKEIKGKKMNDIIDKINKENIIIRFFWLIVGCFMISFAFDVFFIQYDLVCMGITGLSIILQKFMEPSLLILIINIILIIISYFLLGYKQTKNSIIGALLIPAFIYLTKSIVPYFNFDGLEKIVIASIGAVFMGLGNGLIFKNGYTSAGTDIINQIISKYVKITIGNSMLFVDGLIVLCAKLVYSWETVLYGFIILYIVSLLTDKVILGISQSKAFYIVTDKEKKIRDFLVKINNKGVTLLNVKGGYSNDKHTLLLAVVPTRNYFIIKEGLKEIDKNVFFLSCDAYEVIKNQGEKDE